MGQQISITRKNRRKTHKLFTSQYFTNGSNNLSHTFAIIDDEPILDLINVNSASENDLLKVHEIDLELSRNIINHRRSIGFFQKVEDLAVVPGMGAEKLARLKHQICTSSKNTMPSSSQSFDSLRSVDSRTTMTKSNRLVNVNKASVFELQLVHGMTQEIAAGIVYYRSKKGPYKSVEDLRKVKCMDYIRLDNISRFLTVHEDEDIFASVPDLQQPTNTIPNGCLRTNGGPVRYSPIANGVPASALADIFELLSIYSPRPLVKEIFRYSRNDQPAFRVASWNLENFSVTKASNLGVKEVVCRTILENGWSILSIQDVEVEAALKLICDELNEPKLLRVEKWEFNSHQWKYNMPVSENSKLGFIYDARGVDKTTITSSEKGPPELDNFCESLIANFEVGNTKVQILNLKVSADRSDLNEAQYYLQKLSNSETNCLICGDFGLLPDYIDFLNNLGNSKLILPTRLFTRSHSRTNFPKPCTSNFIPSLSFRKHHTGLFGVVKHGLNHLAIPSGWHWGGPVSSCCPVWVEFFVNYELNL